MATQTTATNVEAQAKQQEKEKTEQAAAVTGAQAVADAVNKVAAAAVEGARSARTADVVGDFVVTGHPGGTFHLRAKSGPIFSSSGTVLVGGKAQTIFEWGADYIRGRLDDGVQSGEVVVQIDAQTRRVGYLKV